MDALYAGNSPTLFLKRTLHSSLRNSDKTKRMEHLGKFYIRNGLESKLKQDDGSNQVRHISFSVSTVTALYGSRMSVCN